MANSDNRGYPWPRKHRPLKAVVDAISEGRWEDITPWEADADHDTRATNAMLLVFGRPDHCLWCGLPTHERRILDVDQWFCADHCPICNGWPDERGEA